MKEKCNLCLPLHISFFFSFYGITQGGRCGTVHRSPCLTTVSISSGQIWRLVPPFSGDKWRNVVVCDRWCGIATSSDSQQQQQQQSRFTG